MKKIKAILLIFFVAIAFKSYSQKRIDGIPLKSADAVHIPDQYTKAHDGTELGLNGVTRKPEYDGGVWMVFSDRDDNQTYEDKTCTSRPAGTINFLEPFYVAGETDNAVRLVQYDGDNMVIKDKNAKKNIMGFNEKAQEVGWILKKNVLLWQLALTDDSTGFYKKAVAAKKISEGGNYKDLLKKEILDLYRAPEEDPKKRNDKNLNLFRYLFVFKETNNMVLLGTINKTNTQQIGLDILGWTPRSQVKIWNSALCLKINLDEEAKADRNSKEFNVKFFATDEKARLYRETKDPKSFVGLPFEYLSTERNEKENNQDNANPYFYGFPITDAKLKSENIYKTGYITNTMSESGQSIFSSTKQADLNRDFENLKSNREKIHIIFVVDGSERNYLNTIAKALSANAYIGSRSGTRHDYKLGLIIYNAENYGDDMIQQFSFLSDKDEFIGLLEEQTKIPMTREINRKKGAPVYEAVQKACIMFPNNKSSNMIVLFGTSVNNVKTNRQKVIDALVDKQVNMNFYQVKYEGGSAYDGYFNDCKEFLKKTAEKIDERWNKKQIASGQLAKVELVAHSNDAFILKSTSIPGVIYYKDDPGASFSSPDIEKKLRNMLNKNDERIDYLLGLYEKRTIGTENEMAKLPESDAKEFRTMIQATTSWTDDEIDQLAENVNYQLFIEGYTPIQPKRLSYPLFKKVLFMHEKEFLRLKDDIANLSAGVTPSAVRQKLYDTYRSIIINYQGGNVDQKTLNEFTPDKLMVMMTKISTNNPLFNKKLKEITDSKKTPDSEIDQMKKSFARIGDQLKKIRNDSNAKYIQDDETFYWVDEDALMVDTK